MRCRRSPVVEVHEHRWAACYGEQEILEASERMRFEHGVLVVRQESAHEGGSGIHREVVGPEVDHHLAQRVEPSHCALESSPRDRACGLPRAALDLHAHVPVEGKLAPCEVDSRAEVREGVAPWRIGRRRLEGILEPGVRLVLRRS